jgi:hypothetical protein
MARSEAMLPVGAGPPHAISGQRMMTAFAAQLSEAGRKPNAIFAFHLQNEQMSGKSSQRIRRSQNIGK